MPTWRIDFDAFSVSVDADVDKFVLDQLTKTEELIENLHIKIDELSEKQEAVSIDPEKIKSKVEDYLEKLKTVSLTLTDDSGKKDIISIKVQFIPRSETLKRFDLDKAKIIEGVEEQAEDKLDSLIIKGPRGLAEKTELLAEERFDLERLKVLSGEGTSQVVYEVGEDFVLKVIRMMPGALEEIQFNEIAQQMAEGIHEDLPLVAESGMDYRVVKRVDIDEDRAEEIMGPIREEAFEMAARINEKEAKRQIKRRLKEVDKKFGSNLSLATQFPQADLWDVIAKENIGFEGDVPVNIDPGSLALVDPAAFIETFGGGIEEIRSNVIPDILKRKEELELQRYISTITPEKAEESVRKVERAIIGSMGEEEGRKALAGEVATESKLMKEYERRVAILEEVQKREIIPAELMKGRVETEAGLADYTPTLEMEIAHKAERIADMLKEHKIYAKELTELGDALAPGEMEMFTEAYERLKKASAGDPAEGIDIDSIRTGVFKSMTLHIIKETLKHTDVNVKYKLYGEEPTEDMKSTIENAMTEVVQHYIGVIGNMMKEVSQHV